jgi:lysozyme family protein
MKAEQRMEVGRFIVRLEARRDAKGRIRVYNLRPSDGGGKYEVAGINDRYHSDEVEALRHLISQGKHAAAEERAVAYIATYTDAVAAWTRYAALEAFLRDCCFNRGAKGAAKMLQMALEVTADGVVGPKTLAAAEGIKDAGAVLVRLRKAREVYERKVVGRDERSEYWEGLVNRWEKALRMARGYLVERA